MQQSNNQMFEKFLDTSFKLMLGKYCSIEELTETLNYLENEVIRVKGVLKTFEEQDPVFIYSIDGMTKDLQYIDTIIQDCKESISALKILAN
jgi:G3E family GTPase